MRMISSIEEAQDLFTIDRIKRTVELNRKLYNTPDARSQALSIQLNIWRADKVHETLAK